jgi:hypothetical protein
MALLEDERKLLYFLHRALVQARMMATANNHEQLRDLFDAIELIPSYLHHKDASLLTIIQSEVEAYHKKYRAMGTDCLGDWDVEPPQEGF